MIDVIQTLALGINLLVSAIRICLYIIMYINIYIVLYKE